MKLVVMTKPTFFVEEDKILTSLFDEGLENLHLYKPGATPMYSERLLTLLDEDVYNKITVHDHFYLKEEYKLKGIHIDDAVSEPPKGYKGHISRTCHALNELKDAKKKTDYVFLANTFNSTSTKADTSSYTFAQLEEAHRNGLIDKKVYAMGNINLETMRIARDFGFGGVVVCEDLWDKFDIHQQQDYKELMLYYERARKIVS